ncbi:RecD-like 5'-3' helicase [Stenotrophomonas phage Sonora]|nr:RecD-like 5'-3' helicase [Stenotrophomonas phage Sonora]
MWSPQQEKALADVNRWLKANDKPYYQLAGYAGTGKTTLARHLAEAVSGRVHFAAFTGKAAHVLMKAGVPNASTIHKLIYNPKDKSQQRLKELEAERAKLRVANPIPETLLNKIEAAIKAEQANLARPMFQLNLESDLRGAALVVVDEYSMIDGQMGEDLLSFGVPILALGDPGQLPPVRGAPFFRGRPDTLLTEIHRQAADNPILWMSREVREGRNLRPGVYGESTVSRYRDVKSELAQKVLDADQLLVGRNTTRQSSNRRTRELMGHSNPLPLEGDKLICLRNNHEVGLLNGQMWEARTDSRFDGSYVILDLLGEEDQQVDVLAHPEYFHGNTPGVWTRKDAEEFDYGYAITVHKSQGSQWENVLLFDEWHGNDREKWLYTGLTRAADRIDVIQM